MRGSRLTVRADHDTLKWTLNATEWRGKLEYCLQRFSKFEFDIVHGASIRHQAGDALSQQITTGIGQMSIEDEISVFCFTVSVPPEKGEDKVLNMQDYEELNEKEDIGIPAIHAIATWKDAENDRRPVTVPEPIYKQAKDLYCRQTSSIVGLPA